VRRSARALDLEAPALEPSEDQVQEIVSTRAYDIEYAEEEFVFEPY
jgi:hypothetical protein